MLSSSVSSSVQRLSWAIDASLARSSGPTSASDTRSPGCPPWAGFTGPHPRIRLPHQSRWAAESPCEPGVGRVAGGQCRALSGVTDGDGCRAPRLRDGQRSTALPVVEGHSAAFTGGCREAEQSVLLARGDRLAFEIDDRPPAVPGKAPGLDRRRWHVGPREGLHRVDPDSRHLHPSTLPPRMPGRRAFHRDSAISLIAASRRSHSAPTSSSRRAVALSCEPTMR